MQVIYRPKGGDEQRWPYDADEMPYGDAEALEAALDMPWEQAARLALQGHARVKRALLWVLLRRSNPQLRLSDVQPGSPGEIVVDYTLAELVELRGKVADDSEMDAEAKAEQLWRLDHFIAAEESAGAGDSPKAALSESSG